MTSSRRSFLKKCSLTASSFLIANHVLSVTKEEPLSSDKKKIGMQTLKLGIAGYSFLHFDLEQSLSMMQRMDVHYLCIKDFHLSYDSTVEQITAFHELLKRHNVKGYGVGPIYMKNKEEIDNAFEYARRVGVDLIIGIPEPDDLPYIAEKCKSYNMRYGIHNHGPEDKLYPNVKVVYDQIRDLDQRMGMCFDMGHNVRDQRNSVKDLLQYKDRIFDIHLKNVTKDTDEGTTCELGRGIIDISAFVKALNKIKYTGVCSLEFEKDMKDPLAGIAESAGYFKGVANSQGIRVI